MQLIRRPPVAPRTHSNQPCERGDSKKPKLKRHRNQVLGSVVPRRLADIFSSFTQALSCEVTLKRGTGRAREESGIDMKSSPSGCIH